MIMIKGMKRKMRKSDTLIYRGWANRICWRKTIGIFFNQEKFKNKRKKTAIPLLLYSLVYLSNLHSTLLFCMVYEYLRGTFVWIVCGNIKFVRFEDWEKTITRTLAYIRIERNLYIEEVNEEHAKNEVSFSSHFPFFFLFFVRVK